MIIERTTIKSILPEAADALITNESAPLYNSDYSIRPPIGIYNISLLKIINCFEEVLKKLDHYLNEALFRKPEYDDQFDENITDAQENLLKSIKEHFDDCENVIRCFYPPTLGANNLRSQKIYIDYFDAIKNGFFKHVSDIVNAIKHDHNRLRIITLFNDIRVIPGYFVETVDEKGVIVPNRKINLPVYSKYYPKYFYDTAFSFHRNLRYLLWGIYYTGHHLAKAIYAVTNTTPSKYAASGRMDQRIVNIAERVMKLPMFFYKDELHQDIPTVHIAENNGEKKLKLAYPDNMVILPSADGKYKTFIVFIGDGVSREFQKLYLTHTKE
jgi:hypothetical protein